MLHPDSEQQLLSWFNDFKKENFNSTNELLARFPKCRSIGMNRYIFNIKGNKYRLIVKINFELQTIWVRFVGTHSEYDKINALTI